LTLDGSYSNKKRNGRLVRPATFDYAVKTFPLMIVYLALGKLNNHITISNNLNGREIVSVHVPQRQELQFLLLREDFDICKNIALNLSVPLFSSDKIEDLIKRAHGMVSEAYRNRP